VGSKCKTARTLWNKSVSSRGTGDGVMDCFDTLFQLVSQMNHVLSFNIIFFSVLCLSQKNLLEYRAKKKNSTVKPTMLLYLSQSLFEVISTGHKIIEVTSRKLVPS
jgi:hypothetical protein